MIIRVKKKLQLIIVNFGYLLNKKRNERNYEQPSADSSMWTILRSLQEVPKWQMPWMQGE